jgi:hypothetical protein
MTKYKFPSAHICNQTGISTVQDPDLILAPGQKLGGSITSWEQGKNVIVIRTMIANGGSIPPMFFPPRYAIYRCSKPGCTNEDLFTVLPKHFVRYTRSSTYNSVLFIFGN